MYQYRSNRPSRRGGKFSQVALPFVIIALLVGIVWAGWSLISRLWVDDQRNSSEKTAQLMIDSGSVKAMLNAEEEWSDISGSAAVIAPGEKVKIGPDGRASLYFSPEMELRLNRSSQVELTQFEENTGQYQVSTQLNEGLVWASLGNLASSNSTFKLTTELLSISADSAQFAVQAPGTVYMVRGQGSIEIMENNKPLKSITLGVGQQLVVDEKTIASLKSGKQENLMFALDDDFKNNSFYLWNAEQEGWKTTTDQDPSPEDDADSTAGDTNTEEDAKDSSTEDEESEDKENEEDAAEEPVVTGKVEITSPSKEATYESKTTEFNVEATVPSNTAKVVINGSYTLQQYKAGNTVAKYYVRKTTGNVQEGKNTYTVTAYDKNDKEIGKDSIVVNVTSQTTPSETPDASTPSGTVSITSPSANATYESATNVFDIRATVPAGSTKVVVNDYTLGGYSAGSTSAVYHVKPANGNVSNGDNTYTVTAYDSAGKSLGSDTITVKVNTTSSTSSTTTNTTPPSTPSSSTLSLSFTHPSAGGTYSTTLSPINIGGTVSADIRNLYVNDVPLSTHSLGATSWSMDYTLKQGLNTIKIYGENGANDSTGVKTLTIDYQG